MNDAIDSALRSAIDAIAAARNTRDLGRYDIALSNLQTARAIINAVIDVSTQPSSPSPKTLTPSHP